MMLEEVVQHGDLPSPVSLQRIVCYDNYGLYLISGGGQSTGGSMSRSSSNARSPQMFKLNVWSGRWTKMAPAVPSITNEQASLLNLNKEQQLGQLSLASRGVAFVDRRRLLIVGGRLLGKSFDVPSYSTYVYDVESQSTAVLNCSNLDSTTSYRDVYDQTLLRWNDNFVLCSRVLDNQTGSKRFVFHVLEVSGSEMIWRDLSPEIGSSQPLEGDLCELAIYDDHVYCIDKNDIENCLDVQWRYDLRSRRWENVQSVPDHESSSYAFDHGKPANRMFPTCVTYGECVYVAAGSSMCWAGPKSTPVFSDIWRLHLPTLRWTRMPVQLPEGLWFHSADVSPCGYMYIFGGFADLAGRKLSRRLWRIYLDSPPSLTTIALQILLKKIKLEEQTEEELQKLHMPPCCRWALKW